MAKAARKQNNILALFIMYQKLETKPKKKTVRKNEEEITLL